MSDNNSGPAVWAEIFPVGDGFDFHFKYPNGKIAGHNYDSEELAAEGLSDLLDALAEGFEWKLETRVLRDG